uniref:Secreted protein n=1 Tax=Nelumbo nucifera TaxID=4432 RepID=A0A822Y7U9_NELNU|nr:TPA_asm: hypothetical protein HUJ06_029119 [Nelumbo nucifera]
MLINEMEEMLLVLLLVLLLQQMKQQNPIWSLPNNEFALSGSAYIQRKKNIDRERLTNERPYENVCGCICPSLLSFS